MRITRIPWKLLFMAAAVVGFLWPISNFFSFNVGAIFTAFFAFAVGLFITSLPRPGSRVSFLEYILACAFTGLVAIAIAIALTASTCQLGFLTMHPICTRESGVFYLAIILYGLFLFLSTTFYVLMQE